MEQYWQISRKPSVCTVGSTIVMKGLKHYITIAPHLSVIDFTTCLLTIASRPLVGQVVFHFCWSYWPVGIFWRQNRWKFHEIFQDKKLLSVTAMFINILKLFCQLLPHWLKVSSLTNHFPAFTEGKNGFFKTAIFVFLASTKSIYICPIIKQKKTT